MADPFVVLGDYLREFMPEDDAALLLRFAQNMDAARHLMVFVPVRLNEDGLHVCADCSARVHSIENESHRMTCSILGAWRALGDARWFVNLERCEEEARSHDAARSNRTVSTPNSVEALSFQSWLNSPMSRSPPSRGQLLTWMDEERPALQEDLAELAKDDKG